MGETLTIFADAKFFFFFPPPKVSDPALPAARTNKGGREVPRVTQSGGTRALRMGLRW